MITNQLDKIREILAKRHPLYPSFQWKYHWDAMFSSYCQGCPNFVKRGDRYLHHPRGLSYHIHCAEKLLENTDDNA